MVKAIKSTAKLYRKLNIRMRQFSCLLFAIFLFIKKSNKENPIKI